MTNPQKVRLGHAILDEGASEGSALTFALKLLEGKIQLEARPPRDGAAVSAAEAIMELEDRPIYAFLGLLHPELGTVGIIIVPAWASRCARGVSRCDSGGLGGGKGGFACVKNKTEALRALLFTGKGLEQWESAFLEEISRSYTAAEVDYVHGVTPEYTDWHDARAEGIRYLSDGGVELDRRLWTWEAQLLGSPLPQEIECIVLSPEMYKKLNALRHDGQRMPSSVRILPGELTSSGIHWFDSDPVRAAFLGPSA